MRPHCLLVLLYLAIDDPASQVNKIISSGLQLLRGNGLILGPIISKIRRDDQPWQQGIEQTARRTDYSRCELMAETVKR